MPIHKIIMHMIDKKPNGSPAVLYAASELLPESQANEDLLRRLNESYNATQGKAWGLFHAESGAHPLRGWLSKYIAGEISFHELSMVAVEHLQHLMEESNLAIGGHVLFVHYQQGMTEYLSIAVIQQSEGIAVGEDLQTITAKYLDLDHLHLAGRINLSEWQNNPASRQYISFIKGKNGRKATEYFRDFIGCQEAIDAPGETRTLLRAFSDFVETEDLPEEAAREKTRALVDYAMSQTKLGEPIILEELSGLVDEDQPMSFYDHIRNKDYGLSPAIPADKRTLSRFQRFTGRVEGLSISFEAHLLGTKVKYDKNNDTLVINGVTTLLTDQLKRASVQR